MNDSSCYHQNLHFWKSKTTIIVYLLKWCNRRHIEPMKSVSKKNEPEYISIELSVSRNYGGQWNILNDTHEYIQPDLEYGKYHRTNFLQINDMGREKEGELLWSNNQMQCLYLIWDFYLNTGVNLYFGGNLWVH